MRFFHRLPSWLICLVVTLNTNRSSLWQNTIRLISCSKGFTRTSSYTLTVCQGLTSRSRLAHRLAHARRVWGTDRLARRGRLTGALRIEFWQWLALTGRQRQASSILMIPSRPQHYWISRRQGIFWFDSLFNSDCIIGINTRLRRSKTT